MFLEALKRPDFFCLIYEKDLESLKPELAARHLVSRASVGQFLLLSKN